MLVNTQLKPAALTGDLQKPSETFRNLTKEQYKMFFETFRFFLTDSGFYLLRMEYQTLELQTEFLEALFTRSCFVVLTLP